MHHVRFVWTAIIVITAVILGAAGGTLAWMGGASAPNAVLAGAGGFTATVILLLAIAAFLEGARR
ncbi:hypothetical protein PS9374_04554 [Planomonospora sphaerica]|uniref:Uncharacterized protein n=1 Tax=Planomonospora sphaerica TaxID=161355 RepID=A0A171DJ67_9ACTN|nr:hypothetical protein [Planomonospora sphaerica]GAT68889.1 hypothetical protein PS9374_04554 [Planomonospora sphaerica]